MPSTPYGVLNSMNFQRMISDCAADVQLKNEIITALRSSVPTFFSTYFDLPVAAEQHIGGMTGSDIWGHALATAIERDYTIIVYIADPSLWENAADRIKVRIKGGIEHVSPCETKVWVSIQVEFV